MSRELLGRRECSADAQDHPEAKTGGWLPASLRARLALTFALVVAISLVVAAGSLLALLRGYSERLVQARLDDVAIVVFLQARGQIQRGQSPAQVLDFLEEQADTLDVRFLLADRGGLVVREVGQGSSLLGLRVPLRLETLTSRRPVGGSFVSPRDRVTYQYAALPVGIGAARAGEPGVLLVAQPSGSLAMALGSLLPRVTLAAGAGLLAGLLAAALLARWLGRPLVRLERAARAMAGGDYSQRVEPSGPAELVRLAESFNRMAAEVERSRQIVHRFVGMLSHELRTPLTSIRGFAQAVLDGRAARSDEVQRAMQIVDHEARRMQRLSAELLDLSRLQAGEVPMRRETVDLAALARQCAEVLEARAQEQRVALALELPPDLAVEGDADRLEQVLMNLLDNALKFTPAGGRVLVRGRLVEGERGSPGGPREARPFGRPRTAPSPPRRFAEVEVANPGPPIPPDDLPRIFEQFYTGAPGQARGGVGLGLPIAREIARAHGGDVTAAGEPGLTTFRVLLPASSSFETRP